MENTRTVVWPLRPFSSSVDSARSAADAAATGNSPPQPKPNSACAAVTKAKTACAEDPSAAVSSIPAAWPGYASAVDHLAASILYSTQLLVCMAAIPSQEVCRRAPARGVHAPHVRAGQHR